MKLADQPSGIPSVCRRRQSIGLSLRVFNEVVPAAGSINAAVRLSPERLVSLTGAQWVDVCQ
jgi:prolyl-tRNA editing enzyme YbaK/EbsC (Cys-tRNA(Pro) deacylase)